MELRVLTLLYFLLWSLKISDLLFLFEEISRESVRIYYLLLLSRFYLDFTAILIVPKLDEEENKENAKSLSVQMLAYKPVQETYKAKGSERISRSALFEYSCILFVDNRYNFQYNPANTVKNCVQ